MAHFLILAHFRSQPLQLFWLECADLQGQGRIVQPRKQKAHLQFHVSQFFTFTSTPMILLQSCSGSRKCPAWSYWPWSHYSLTTLKPTAVSVHLIINMTHLSTSPFFAGICLKLLLLKSRVGSAVVGSPEAKMVVKKSLQPPALKIFISEPTFVGSILSTNAKLRPGWLREIHQRFSWRHSTFQYSKCSLKV